MLLEIILCIMQLLQSLCGGFIVMRHLAYAVAVRDCCKTQKNVPLFAPNDVERAFFNSLVHSSRSYSILRIG